MCVIQDNKYSVLLFSIQGIYRNSARQDLVYKLCQDVEENQESINFETEDLHVICNVLKEYLRRLREPLLTFEHYQDLIAFGMVRQNLFSLNIL